MAENRLPNLYEVLELTPVAGRSEIIDALQRLRSIYGSESDASYTLFSAEDRQRILSELELAEYYLLDTDRRTQYDREILGIGGTRHELPPPQSVQQIPLPVSQSQPVAMPVIATLTPVEALKPRQPIGFRPPTEAVAAELATPAPAAMAVPSFPPPLASVAPVVSPAPAVPGVGTATPVAKPAPGAPAAARQPVYPPVPVIPSDRPRPDPTGYFADVNDYTGKNLRRYREASGISLREISAITRIPPQHLENIEADDFGLLPAPVYLKGFLKSYCKVLNLNPQAVDGYMNHVRIYMELHKK